MNNQENKIMGIGFIKNQLIDDNNLRKLMASNSRQSIDGNGAKRIRELIEIKFKDVFL